MEEKLWNSNYVKVCIANFMIFFSFMLLTPILPIYLYDTFGADKHVSGVVLSGYVVMALLSRMVSGYLVDSFSRKRVLLFSYFLFFIFFSGYVLAGSLLLFALVRTLHGASFGATTVANSTVAIDVLHPKFRPEGIGYYGLGNNLATAVSPSVALLVYYLTKDYNMLFLLALLTAGVGFAINYTVTVPEKEIVKNKKPISLDRFFLLKGIPQSISISCLAFSYGVVSTYVAIYGRETLGITGGAGLFFMLLAIGLICSRLMGSKSLRQGRVTHNAALGCVISMIGYLVFALFQNAWGYYVAALIIGLGNGHMFPAYQTMFVNLAEHNQRGTANSSILVSWDVGVGLGILIGGVVSEYFGYEDAFWVASTVNAIGVLTFFLHARRHYERNKLR